MIYLKNLGWILLPFCCALIILKCNADNTSPIAEIEPLSGIEALNFKDKEAVSLTITDKNNAPIAGALVLFKSEQLFSATSEKDGKANAEVTKGTNYEVAVYAPGYHPYNSNRFNKGETIKLNNISPQKVASAQKLIAPIKIQLLNQSREPLLSCMVMVSPENSEDNPIIFFTNDFGEVEISGLPHNNYICDVYSLALPPNNHTRLRSFPLDKKEIIIATQIIKKTGLKPNHFYTVKESKNYISTCQSNEDGTLTLGPLPAEKSYSISIIE